MSENRLKMNRTDFVHGLQLTSVTTETEETKQMKRERRERMKRGLFCVFFDEAMPASLRADSSLLPAPSVAPSTLSLAEKAQGTVLLRRDVVVPLRAPRSYTKLSLALLAPKLALKNTLLLDQSLPALSNLSDVDLLRQNPVTSKYVVKGLSRVLQSSDSESVLRNFALNFQFSQCNLKHREVSLKPLLINGRCAQDGALTAMHILSLQKDLKIICEPASQYDVMEPGACSNSGDFQPSDAPQFASTSVLDYRMQFSNEDILNFIIEKEVFLRRFDILDLPVTKPVAIVASPQNTWTWSMCYSIIQLPLSPIQMPDICDLITPITSMSCSSDLSALINSLKGQCGELIESAIMKAPMDVFASKRYMVPSLPPPAPFFAVTMSQKMGLKSLRGEGNDSLLRRDNAIEQYDDDGAVKMLQWNPYPALVKALGEMRKELRGGEEETNEADDLMPWEAVCEPDFEGCEEKVEVDCINACGFEFEIVEPEDLGEVAPLLDFCSSRGISQRLVTVESRKSDQCHSADTEFEDRQEEFFFEGHTLDDASAWEACIDTTPELAATDYQPPSLIEFHEEKHQLQHPNITLFDSNNALQTATGRPSSASFSTVMDHSSNETLAYSYGSPRHIPIAKDDNNMYSPRRLPLRSPSIPPNVPAFSAKRSVDSFMALRNVQRKPLKNSFLQVTRLATPQLIPPGFHQASLNPLPTKPAPIKPPDRYKVFDAPYALQNLASLAPKRRHTYIVGSRVVQNPRLLSLLEELRVDVIERVSRFELAGDGISGLPQDFDVILDEKTCIIFCPAILLFQQIDIPQHNNASQQSLHSTLMKLQLKFRDITVIVDMSSPISNRIAYHLSPAMAIAVNEWFFELKGLAGVNAKLVWSQNIDETARIVRELGDDVACTIEASLAAKGLSNIDLPKPWATKEVWEFREWLTAEESAVECLPSRINHTYLLNHLVARTLLVLFSHVQFFFCANCFGTGTHIRTLTIER
ncbi:hypothetical protein BC830DRAFT_1129407 [Chytriomyces sp. MP71]|nr:hypothetical protein BC830DRAFT_1129407 [Chytriomyces sp. MP71]